MRSKPACGRLPMIQDLVIDALEGQPGVKSARFAGSKDSDRKIVDRKNYEKVLKLLKDVPV